MKVFSQVKLSKSGPGARFLEKRERPKFLQYAIDTIIKFLTISLPKIPERIRIRLEKHFFLNSKTQKKLSKNFVEKSLTPKMER